MINIDIQQSLLSSFNNLVAAVDKTKAMGATFDLMLTPVAGVDGAKDSLVMEISRSNCYGSVVITDGIKVTSGSGESVLISSKSFQSLPKNPKDDEPLNFEVTDKVYVKYPNSPGFTDLKFDLEYSESPASFLRRTHVETSVGMDQNALPLFTRLVDQASKYTEEKRLDDAMSVVNVDLNEAGVVRVEATTGTEGFFAELQLVGCSAKEAVSCMHHPAIWSAGLTLSQGQVLGFGFDKQNITFVAGNCALTHSQISFADFPAIGNMIQEWVKEVKHANFSATISPALLKQRLDILTPMAAGNKTAEPSFIFAPKTPKTLDKALVKLQGFTGSGQIVIDDPAVMDINWTSDKAKVRIPARLASKVMDTCSVFGLTFFFDIEGVNSVFFSDQDSKVFILVGQEETE